MRKFKFTTQMLILYLLLLILTSVLFSLIVIGRVNTISDSQTFDRLQSYITISRNDWRNSEQVSTDDDVNIVTIQGNIEFKLQGPFTRIYIDYESSNLLDYVTESERNDILKTVTSSASPGTSGQSSLSKSVDSKVYFAFEIEQPTNANDDINFIIAITNGTLAKSFRKTIAYQIIAIFSIVLTFAFLILGLWGGGYVSRINRIKTHISNLPKTNYKEEYTDSGKDELADLSNSIEEMRKEILTNESTKQDMLQNLSHDFKTPIAVIKSYGEAIGDGMTSKEDAAIIVKQAGILQHKVTKLLQYNRLEYLEKKEEFYEVPMKEIINDVVNTYRYQAKNIEFIIEADDSKFKGYQENFYTVVDNLIDNAKRYAKSKIIVTLKNNVLTVYNDGEPIDEQFLNGLFKAYEKGSKGQFGLGMSIVKKTLDFFEYELSLKNEEVGVTFTIKKSEQKPIFLQ